MGAHDESPVSADDVIGRAICDHEPAARPADFRRAIDEFTESYRLDPAPVVLFNVAQAHAQLGDMKKAMFFYEQYLADAPRAAEFRPLAERRLVELRRGARRSATAAAAQEQRDTPNLRVEPPRQSEAPAPQKAPPQPAVAPPIPERAPRLYTLEEIDRADRVFRNSGLVLNGVGVILTAAGVGLTFVGLGLKGKIDEAYGMKDTSLVDDLTTRKDALVITGSVTAALGVTAMAAGVLSLALPTRYRLWIISVGQGIGLVGKF